MSYIPQDGTGLSDSGKYIANQSSNYLDEAISLKDADNKLDLALANVAKGNKNVIIKTSNYSITTTDDTIICNSTTPFTLTLPEATGSGHEYTLVNENTGAVTLAVYSTNTINGSSSQTLLQNSSYQIIDALSGKWLVI